MSGSKGEALLLLAFNRPDSLQRVIDATRPHRPPRVYLAVDGPRAGHDDHAAVQACRELAGAIDWGAEVHTLFRDGNLGCGRGVSSAITWFFENEERGVILEDDVVPTAPFFDFQSSMLSRYADDPRVFSVAGSTFAPRECITRPGDYRFSRYPYVWGWGLWRRTWAQYRFELGSWRTELPVRELWERTGRSLRATAYWRMRFDQQSHASIDTWDYQLTFASLHAGSLTVVSNTNLTENIGFDDRATHTRRRPPLTLMAGEPPQNPVDPVDVVADPQADSWTMRNQMGATLPRLLYNYSR